MIEKLVETNEPLETCLAIITSQPVLPDENHPSCIIEEYAHAKIDLSRASRTFPRRPRCRASMRRRTASCRSCRIKHSQRSAGGTPPMTNALTVSYSSPSPTFPRKLALVDWGSRKRTPNKTCAECWPGAASGPYWLLTERLSHEMAPLLPALRDSRTSNLYSKFIAHVDYDPNISVGNTLGKSLTPIAKRTLALASLLSESLNLRASSSIWRRSIL